MILEVVPSLRKGRLDIEKAVALEVSLGRHLPVSIYLASAFCGPTPELATSCATGAMDETRNMQTKEQRV